jgi:hypothetical protein
LSCKRSGQKARFEFPPKKASLFWRDGDCSQNCGLSCCFYNSRSLLLALFNIVMDECIGMIDGSFIAVATLTDWLVTDQSNFEVGPRNFLTRIKCKFHYIVLLSAFNERFLQLSNDNPNDQYGDAIADMKDNTLANMHCRVSLLIDYCLLCYAQFISQCQTLIFFENTGHFAGLVKVTH